MGAGDRAAVFEFGAARWTQSAVRRLPSLRSEADHRRAVSLAGFGRESTPSLSARCAIKDWERLRPCSGTEMGHTGSGDAANLKVS